MKITNKLAKMQALLIVVFFVTLSLWSGPETVNGYTWSYWTSYSDGLAYNWIQAGGYSISSPAISPSPVGEVIIPASFNGIPNRGLIRTFYNCTELTKVTIPDTITSIGEGSFYGCSSLSHVDMPNSVTYIGDTAFCHCSSLTSLVIPNGVTGIGEQAFEYCRSLKGNSLTEGLIIPDSVTSIGRMAFEGCSSLTGLTIGKGVISIGGSAFYGCSGITGVLIIPNGVTSIGNEAFQNCSGLTGVLTIPDSMTSIARSTFSGCSGLTEVRIGANISSIGSYAFSGCTSAATFSFAGAPPSVDSSAFRNVKSGAIGTYTAEPKAEWEAVIGADGKWNGLIMKEIVPPPLTLVAESADWSSGSITLCCRDGDTSSTAHQNLQYYDTAKGQWSEIERDELEIPPPVIETNENGGEVLVTRITDKKFSCRNNGLGILRYRVTDESERIAVCATRDRHGLFVSVDDYANPDIIDLLGDASREARVFKRAYETYGGASGFIHELTDSMATKNGILTKLDGIVEEVKVGDIFLFYFAGHGGRGYVECNDSDKNVSTAVGKITAHELRTRLESFKEGVGIVAIINCCHSESMFIRNDDEDDDDNIGWIMAAREDQTAGGGRFGEIVCDEGWFKGLADKRGEYGQGNNNGYVTFWELAEYGFGWTTANPYYVNNHGIRRTQQINFKTDFVLGNIVAGRVPPQDRANRMLSWSMWFSSVFEFSGGDITAVEGRTAANGCRTVGECYALGIDPEDPFDDLRITAFRKEDGQPVITVNHTTDGSGNSFADRIRTLGKKSLMDAEWVDITDMDQSEYRFFKVAVEIDDGDSGEINMDDLVIEQGVLQRYVGEASDVVIPSSVTSIGNYAFAGNTNLVSVTIPGSVTNIGDYAFAGCEGLTSVTFNGNAPTLGDSCFEWGAPSCTVYVSRGSSGWGVAIPGTWNGMQIEYADDGSGNSAPANDERANAETLSGASGTRSFSTVDATVEGDEPIVLSCEDVSASVWFKWTAPIRGRATFSTAGSDFDTVLGVYRYDTLAEVAFNNDADGNNTSRCTFIAQEGQSYYVVVAGYGGSGAAALSWECVEGGTPTFTIEDGVLTAVELNGAFDVTIPGTVREIGESAFDGCEDLVSVVMSNGVAKIDDYAFYNCSSLESVTLPYCLTNIGKYAFAYCHELAAVTLPEGVTNVGNGAFYRCDGLTSVALPRSLTSIGEEAFAFCGGIESFTVSDGNPAYKVQDGMLLTKNGGVLLHGADGDVSIPSGVTRIANGAFASCVGLTNVTIPTSVTSISSYAFSGCDGLTNLEIPNSVQYIGKGVFQHCRGLADDDGFVIVRNVLYDSYGNQSEVEVPQGVVKIEDRVFASRWDLTKVTIPSSVSSIGSYLFDNSSNLTNVTFEGNAPTVNNYSFVGVGSSCTVYVKRESSGWGVTIPGTWNGLPIRYKEVEE